MLTSLTTRGFLAREEALIYPPVDSQAKGTVTVRVRNASKENVYLVQKGGSYGPANRLAPGQTRDISVIVPPNGMLEFCAGRNGQMTQCNKTGVDPSDRGGQYTVTFDESNPFKKVLITPELT